MTNLEAKKPNMNENVCPPISPETLNAIKKVLGRVLRYVPGLIVFALIALYYIQLSHMGA